MASAKLQLIQRRLERQNPERIPAPDTSGGIGAAIEELIANEVSQRVGEAVKEKSNRHLDRLFKPEPKYTDFKQIPQAPRTPFPPKTAEMTFERDELGRISKAFMGQTVLLVQRNELGQMVRLIPEDIAPPQPCVPPPALAAYDSRSD